MTMRTMPTMELMSAMLSEEVSAGHYNSISLSGGEIFSLNPLRVYDTHAVFQLSRIYSSARPSVGKNHAAKKQIFRKNYISHNGLPFCFAPSLFRYLAIETVRLVDPKGNPELSNPRCL